MHCGRTKGNYCLDRDSHDCSINEIALLHNHFAGGTFGVCSDGALVARSLSVEDSTYTSQLNVTISPEIAGKTIMTLCVHDNLSNIIIRVSYITPSTGNFHRFDVPLITH